MMGRNNSSLNPVLNVEPTQSYRDKRCSKCHDPGITQRAAMPTVSNLQPVTRMWPGDPRQLKIWNMTLALD